MADRETIPHTAEGAIRAIKLLAERDAEIATLRAANEELMAVLDALVGRNLTYIGGDILIAKKSHGDAIAAVSAARIAYEKHKGDGV